MRPSRRTRTDHRVVNALKMSQKSSREVGQRCVDWLQAPQEMSCKPPNLNRFQARQAARHRW